LFFYSVLSQTLGNCNALSHFMFFSRILMNVIKQLYPYLTGPK